jgi:hypothetical protein
MKRFFAVLMLLSFVFMAFACAGPQTVKPYAVVKATAEEILFDARVMQNKALITADEFAKVVTVYDKIKAAQDAVIDGRQTYAQISLQYDALLQANTDPEALNSTYAKLQVAQQALNANMAQVTALLSELAGIAAQLGIKGVN